MTGLCAQRTAGVDVERTLETTSGAHVPWAEAVLGPGRNELQACETKLSLLYFQVSQTILIWINRNELVRHIVSHIGRVFRSMFARIRGEIAWYNFSLIALIFFSILPSIVIIMTIIWYKLTDNLPTILGLQIDPKNFKIPSGADVIGLPLLIAAGNWSYFLLYFLSRFFAKRGFRPARLYKAGMWGSILAMALPNLVLVVATPSEFFIRATDAGQGTGVFLSLIMFGLGPVLGFFGWLLGAAVAAFWEP
jgi:hypothetical protein